MEITLKEIGHIHTDFKALDNMPIQPIVEGSGQGYIELYPEYEAGLKDVDGFSHLILIYHLHLVKEEALQVVPFMDTELRGIFSCRAPKRPNRIGISTVKLVKVEGCRLYIDQIDVLDGTPLMDIKPFFGHFDNRLEAKSGWLDKKKQEGELVTTSDKRFVED